MAKAVFIHNQSSKYDDDPARHYHFPKQYLKRVSQTLGDWIVYYESGKNKGRKSYIGVAQVLRVRPDLQLDGHYYADVKPNSFLPMEREVPLRSAGRLFESQLAKPGGGINGGRAISAVRILPDADFARIIAYGLPDETAELPRYDFSDFDQGPEFIVEENHTSFEFGEAVTPAREWDRVLSNRKRRDRTFRSVIIKAYDKTCAFTGLRFINGGGRAEVQAAHIRPVEHDGPDSVNNGIALSGTAHWMFDRGLLSLADDGEILVSRHINNTEEIDRLLVNDRQARLPALQRNQPHPSYLAWHREECFKH